MYLNIQIDLAKTRGGLAETSRMIVADALRTLADEIADGMGLDGAGNVDTAEFGETVGFWEVAP